MLLSTLCASLLGSMLGGLGEKRVFRAGKETIKAGQKF